MCAFYQNMRGKMINPSHSLKGRFEEKGKGVSLPIALGNHMSLSKRRDIRGFQDYQHLKLRVLGGRN